MICYGQQDCKRYGVYIYGYGPKQDTIEIANIIPQIFTAAFYCRIMAKSERGKRKRKPVRLRNIRSGT